MSRRLNCIPAASRTESTKISSRWLVVSGQWPRSDRSPAGFRLRNVTFDLVDISADKTITSPPPQSIDVKLTKEDLADLDRKFPPPKSKESLPML